MVPLLLIALDESFHPVLPSTVSAPILDLKPGQAAELSLSLDAFFIKSLQHLTSLNQCQINQCRRKGMSSFLGSAGGIWEGKKSLMGKKCHELLIP